MDGTGGGPPAAHPYRGGMTDVRGRRFPWFESVCAAILLGVAAVCGVALYRHLSTPDLPVLPTSWCRVGPDTTLPPLLGTAMFTRWRADPIALAVLGVVGVLYLAGFRTVRRRGAVPWPAGRAWMFLAGLAVCGLATNSSVAVYDMALFSAHMIGHLMLVMLGPVLLCAGQPIKLLVEASADPWHDRVLRALHGRVATVIFFPPVALATYASAIVLTHLTGLMNEIMLNPWAGQLEHLVYVVVGVQFFTLIAGDDPPIRWQLSTPARWVLLAISMAVDTFTGVILLMFTRPVSMTMTPGLTVNGYTDTQTGGAIMWVGGDGIMAVIMIVLTVRWLANADLRRRDRDGFVERARRSTFATHTGSDVPDGPSEIEFDEDEARLATYNAWLARMADQSGGAPRR